LFLQRLFSTFPDGWPGIGLLLLRLGAGSALIGLGIVDFTTRDLLEVVGASVLVIGLWTPLAGIFIAVDQLWVASSVAALPRADQWLHILIAILAAAIAMLGPGAWSIDARRFGRKRVDIDRTRSGSPPR
jgi:putative oxidoreductase